MYRKILFYLIFFILLFNKSEAKELSNSVVVSIDNAIITEFDIYKEKNFIKFINKNELTSDKELLKKKVLNILIERKIKEIETNTLNIEVSEKEVENDVNNYLIEAKLNNDLLDLFYNNNELEKDYLKNIIKIEIKWSKLINQFYQNRINLNLTEINREVQKEEINSEDKEMLKKNMIANERNNLLNKFSVTHLEKCKKKYLIKFL
jgi:hypothetical protein